MKKIIFASLFVLTGCTQTPPLESPEKEKTPTETKACFPAKSIQRVLRLKGTVIKSKGQRFKIHPDAALKGVNFMLKEGNRLKNHKDPKDKTKMITTCEYEAYLAESPDKIIGKVKIMGHKTIDLEK